MWSSLYSLLLPFSIFTRLKSASVRLIFHISVSYNPSIIPVILYLSASFHIFSLNSPIMSNLHKDLTDSDLELPSSAIFFSLHQNYSTLMSIDFYIRKDMVSTITVLLNYYQ